MTQTAEQIAEQLGPDESLESVMSALGNARGTWELYFRAPDDSVALIGTMPNEEYLNPTNQIELHFKVGLK